MIDRSFKICNNWNSFHNDIENIKSNLIKNAYHHSYPIKPLKHTSIISFLVHKFNWKTHLTSITLNYYISATFRTILKINFRNFWKEFCKENFNMKLVFNSFKIRSYFSYKDPIPNDLKFLYINLLVLDAVLAILAKLVVILKLELKNISKMITSCTYLNIYTPSIDKANSKFDLKMKKVSHINWKKSNLNVQQNHLALTLSDELAPLLCFFLSLLFCLSLSSVISIMSDINYRHPLLS